MFLASILKPSNYENPIAFGGLHPQTPNIVLPQGYNIYRGCMLCPPVCHTTDEEIFSTRINIVSVWTSGSAGGIKLQLFSRIYLFLKLVCGYGDNMLRDGKGKSWDEEFLVGLLYVL